MQHLNKKNYFFLVIFSLLTISDSKSLSLSRSLVRTLPRFSNILRRVPRLLIHSAATRNLTSLTNSRSFASKLNNPQTGQALTGSLSFCNNNQRFMRLPVQENMPGRFFSTARITQKEAYELFNLNPERRISEPDLIKINNYLRQMYHPDKNLNVSDIATEMFKRINEAFEKIKQHQNLLYGNSNEQAQGYDENALKVLRDILNKKHAEWQKSSIDAQKKKKIDDEYQKYKAEEEKREQEKREKEQKAFRQKTKYIKRAAIAGSAAGAGYITKELYDKYCRTKAYYFLKQRLLEAIKIGDTSAVKKILEDKKFDLNIKDSEYNLTGFTLAACFGYADIVNSLLNDSRFNRNNFNELDSNGNNALNLALINGHAGVVRLLLNHFDIDFWYKNKQNRAVIDLADPIRNEEVYLMLIEKLEQQVSQLLDPAKKAGVDPSLSLKELWNKHSDEESTSNLDAIYNLWLYDGRQYINDREKIKIFILKNSETALAREAMINDRKLDIGWLIFSNALKNRDYEMMLILLRLNMFVSTGIFNVFNVQQARLLKKYGADFSIISGSSSVLHNVMTSDAYHSDLILEYGHLFAGTPIDGAGNTPWHTLAMNCAGMDIDIMLKKIEKYWPIAGNDFSLRNRTGKTATDIVYEHSGRTNSNSAQTMLRLFRTLEIKQKEITKNK